LEFTHTTLDARLSSSEKPYIVCQTQIDYLGHVMSKERVKLDDNKIQAVKQWPIPSSIRQIWALLGLARYYLKFIRHFAVVAVPLTDLLKKNAFKWSDRAIEAFLNLEQAQVLALPDFSHPFILETDVLGIGIGEILSQQGHAIAYFSKKLSIAQRQSAYAREM